MRRMTEPTTPDALALARDLRPARSATAPRAASPTRSSSRSGPAPGSSRRLPGIGDPGARRRTGRGSPRDGGGPGRGDRPDRRGRDPRCLPHETGDRRGLDHLHGDRGDDLPSTKRMVVQSMVGTRPNRARDATERLEADIESKTFREGETVNLVVIDLLWLDGDWLLDVRSSSASGSSRRSCPAIGSCGRARTSGRRSTPGSDRGAPRGSRGSRSARPTPRIGPGSPRRTGPPPRCRVADAARLVRSSRA